MKIPHQITLPGHYRIRIRIVTRSQAKLFPLLDRDAYASWSIDDRTIYLRKSRTGTDRMEDFLHEMEHAFTDWKDYFRGRTEQEGPCAR